MEPTAQPRPLPSQSHDEDGEEVCWICLDGHTPEKPLELPCKCPRKVHLACLARWQLQSAGKNEEDRCRFCMTKLPDWKTSLTPNNVKPVVPVMAIKFEGKTYKLRVRPGPDGLKEFQQQVRQLLGFDITDEFDVTFECQIPQTGEKMKLTGLNSYGAATHCAAITAAQREVKPSRHHHKSSSATTSPASRSAVPPVNIDSNGPILSNSGQQLRSAQVIQYPETTLLHNQPSSSARLVSQTDMPSPAVLCPLSSTVTPRGEYQYRSRSMPDFIAVDELPSPVSGPSSGSASLGLVVRQGEHQSCGPVNPPVRVPLLSKTAQIAKEKISKLLSVLDLSKP